MPRKPPRRMFRRTRPDPEHKTTVKAYDPNDLRYVAMHEAGHAVAAIVHGSGLKSVDINRSRLPGGLISLGFTDSDIPTDQEIYGKGEAVALPHLICQLAGPFSEALDHPQIVNGGLVGGDQQDVENARRIAVMAVCEGTWNGDKIEISPEEITRNHDRLQKLWGSAQKATDLFVKQHQRSIRAVALALNKRQRLTGDEVQEIGTETGTQLVLTVAATP
jgi:hypothetical protein